jgi:hypothetical protein
MFHRIARGQQYLVLKCIHERAARVFQSTAWTPGQHEQANTPGQGWGVHKLLMHIDTGSPEVAHA